MVVINISDDDDSDFVASSRSVACAKRKISRREDSRKNQKLILRRKDKAVVAAPAVSRSRTSKDPKKKKVERQVLVKKASPISIGDEIPQAVIDTYAPGLFGGFQPADYDIHASLRGKRVIIYGLPGYFANICLSGTDPKYQVEVKIWKSFCKKRIMDPAYEFAESYEGLKEKGVDKILFMPVNHFVVCGVRFHHPKLRYGFFQFVADRYTAVVPPGVVTYYDSLGLETDIQETEWNIPLRTRRFVLVVDDLKIKLASIESSNKEFNIPTVDEIVESFGGGV